MKTIQVEIEGTSPLLMHKIGKAAMESMMKKTRKQTVIPSPEQAAEDSAYKNADGELFVPARCIKACIVRASSWYKIGRKSARQFIAGATRIEPYEVLLGTKEYVIDLRPVVIQRSRIIRARPRIDKWKLKFNIVYNEDVFATKDMLELLKTVVEEGGIRCGLLDNRPERAGENGTFKLTKWKILK